VRIGKKHALIWGGLFLFIVAISLRVNQLFIMAAAVGLLAPVSYLLSSRSLQSLRVRRLLPQRLTTGESAAVQLIVHNTSRRPHFLVQIQDSLPDGLTAPDGNEHLIVDLAAREQRTITYKMLPLRRGVYELSPLTLLTNDAIGLFEFATSAAQPQQLVVYPKPIALPDMWPEAARASISPKTRKRIRGREPDLYGVREYVPGDDLRRIHWKATAHRGKLTIVERERPQDMAAVVILDLSRHVHSGRGNESSLEYGVTLAASLLVQALAQGRRASLIAQGEVDHSVPACEYPGQRIPFLEALARVEAHCSQSLHTIINEKRRQLYQVGSVAVISPQVGQPMLRLATALQEWGNSVTWFSLAAPTFEDQGGGEGRYQRFITGLRRRGCRTHSIRGGAGLASAIGGRQRIARPP